MLQNPSYILRQKFWTLSNDPRRWWIQGVNTVSIQECNIFFMLPSRISVFTCPSLREYQYNYVVFFTRLCMVETSISITTRRSRLSKYDIRGRFHKGAWALRQTQILNPWLKNWWIFRWAHFLSLSGFHRHAQIESQTQNLTHLCSRLKHGRQTDAKY